MQPKLVGPMTVHNHPTKEELLEGTVLLFDKPYRWTSFDVVGKVRSLLRKKLGARKPKIGHAGTLDPLATGLLIVCTGSMTKTIEQYQAMEKEYTGTLYLGKSTPSYDLETKPDKEYPTDHIGHDMILEAAGALTGRIDQVPPLFSAKKVEGERAYEIARRGGQTVLKAKTITISEFGITRIELPEVDFRVVCSKGTYIRSLARDFGHKLQSGAYLKALRRTRTGHYQVDQAWTIDSFENLVGQLQQ